MVDKIECPPFFKSVNCDKKSELSDALIASGVVINIISMVLSCIMFYLTMKLKKTPWTKHR